MIDEATGEEKVVEWYVKYEDGRIAGPMPKQEALDRAGEVEALAFSDGVFELYHLPKDVTEIVTGLLSFDLDSQLRDDSLSLLKRAAEMLTILSRPREVTATISGGVFEIETIAQGVHLVIRDYDVVEDSPHGDLVQEDESGKHLVMEYGS